MSDVWVYAADVLAIAGTIGTTLGVLAVISARDMKAAVQAASATPVIGTCLVLLAALPSGDWTLTSRALVVAAALVLTSSGGAHALMRLTSVILDRMPICKECEDEVDELVAVKVGGRKKKLCEDCAERLQEEAAIAEESESVVQNMMGFKGRR